MTPRLRWSHGPRSLLLLVPFLAGCDDPCATCPGTTGDWPLATPASQGLDGSLLRTLTDELAAGTMGPVSSLLIIRNGHLVYEEYFQGMTAKHLHPCYSVTKSFASALVGIARSQGRIGDLNTPILEYFPQYPEVENDGPWKQAITLEHALQMRTGILWDELSTNYSHPDNPVAQLFQDTDWLKHMLDQPMAAEPGTEFVYNTGVSVLLSGVLQNVTGQSAEAFAEDVLFGPMGIREWHWHTSPMGVTDTGGGLALRPRDMVKLGYLYLREGVWEPTGERLLPTSWVQASTQTHTHDGAGGGYGYQWWVQSLAVSGEEMRFPYAVGWGGQRIYVIPELDMVVAMTAEGYEGETIRRGTILLDYIFPSAE